MAGAMIAEPMRRGTGVLPFDRFNSAAQSSLSPASLTACDQRAWGTHHAMNPSYDAAMTGVVGSCPLVRNAWIGVASERTPM